METCNSNNCNNILGKSKAICSIADNKRTMTWVFCQDCEKQLVNYINEKLGKVKKS